MRTIYPDKILVKDLHQFMLGSIIPRPIALVSTRSANGDRNIAPFSYFNAISSNPPILAFSVARNSDGSRKDTLVNILETKECVINMVNEKIANQMALAGVYYPPDVDEFLKSGFTELESKEVAVPRVKEAPIQFECTLNRVVYFNEESKEMAHVICDVKCFHINEDVIDERNRIEPAKLNLLGRLGRAYYLKVNDENIFTLAQGRTKSPIGFDSLPSCIVESDVLTGNEIAQVAAVESLPDSKGIDTQFPQLSDVTISTKDVHTLAKQQISNGNVIDAVRILLYNSDLRTRNTD